MASKRSQDPDSSGDRSRRGKRDPHHDDLGAAISEVSGAVSDAVVEVGDAVGAIIESVSTTLARRRRLTPAQRLVKKARQRRREWLSHRNSYVAVNLGLAGLNLATAVASGSFHPWFIYPLLGWGMGIGIHALNYRGWLKDHRDEIDSAELEVASIGLEPREPSALDQRVGDDPEWTAIVARCRGAVGEAKANLGRSDDAALREQTTARLHEGMAHLDRPALGAVTIRRAVSAVVPDGAAGLDGEIAALDAKIESATDVELVGVYRSNRELLAVRRGKVERLQTEYDRMLARAEGFLMAVQNIQLDASRFTAGVPGTDTLTEPLRQLSEEVAILQAVEEELAAFR